MSKLWFVNLTFTAVVIADDEKAAYMEAHCNAGDIFRDSADPAVEVMHEVNSCADLSDGWDNDCVPYGGDGNTRIGDLLLAQNSEGTNPVLGEHCQEPK